MSKKSEEINSCILNNEVREFLTRSIEYSEKLEKEIEQLRVQLNECSTAAFGGIKSPAKSGDYSWSPAYQDVLNLRHKYEEVVMKFAK